MCKTCLSLSDLFHSVWQSLVHSCCNKWHYFILFYGWAVFHCIFLPHLLYPLLCQWNLDCLHVSAVVNSAAMKIGVLVSFCIIGMFVYLQEVGLLYHMVILFLVFWKISILFSIVAVPAYIPTYSVGGFPSLHTLSSICYL